jgi:hypothetical protein
LSSRINFDTTKTEGDGYYTFYVLATDKAGNTQQVYTNSLTVFVKARSVDKPTGVFATVSDKQVILKWNAVPGAVYYEIWRASSPYSCIATVPADQSGQLSYVDTSVVPGKTYNYQIFAVNAAGYKSEAAVISTSLAQIVPVVEKTTPTITPSQGITGQPESKIESQPKKESVVPEAQAQEPEKVLGEEKQEESRNWTPLIVVVSLMILGIAGYMGWKWFAASKTPEEIKKEDRW